MELNIHYLSGPDVQALALTNDEILDAIEGVWQHKDEVNASLNRACTSFRISLIPVTLTFSGYIGSIGVAGVRLLEIF